MLKAAKLITKELNKSSTGVQRIMTDNEKKDIAAKAFQ